MNGRAVLACLATTVAACTAPMRAVRVDLRRAHRSALRTELASGELSQHARNFIYEHGVGAYESAPIAGVASELVVTSAHSCQANLHTINEARRILLEHLRGE